jgi:L-cysteine/cystine lyase
MMDWNSIRARFPITERMIYLNTGWAGPSPREAVVTMQQRTEREAYDGPQSLHVRSEKAELINRVRHAVASLIGADDDELALIYTTTEGMNTVLRGIGLAPGDHVITCNLEHNAIMVPSYMARLRDGADLSILRFRSDEDAARIVDAFEAAMTPRTKLLMLSHVSFNRGTRLPMRDICEMAHQRGALVAVDAAQSAGHVDFDVREMNCDFLALPGHKWLLGPSGAAFLFVRRDLIERLQPLAVVHGANAGYDYEGNFEYANATIHKFELTTHSGPVLAGLEASLALVGQIGVPAIETRAVSLASRLIDAIEGIDGVRITTPLDRSVRSGIVTFAVRDLDPSETVSAFWCIDRIVMRVCNDRRVRACFHLFNDERDVDRTADAVAQVAARGLPAGTLSEAEYKRLLAEAYD